MEDGQVVAHLRQFDEDGDVRKVGAVWSVMLRVVDTDFWRPQGLLYDEIAPAESVRRQKQKPSSIKTSAQNAVVDATTQTAGDVTNGAMHLVGIGGEAMLQPIRVVGRHFYKRQKERHLKNLEKLRSRSEEESISLEPPPPER
eukprot:scaffold209_cov396-Prasinococcus_capsulatus_cf.AAC.12